MNNAEHLVENAIIAYNKFADGKMDFKDARKLFDEDEKNIDLASHCDISLLTAWNIGMYVVDYWIKE